MPSLLQILLVPVIILCAFGGTVGLLKLIQKFFPGAFRAAEKTQEWIDKHNTSCDK